MYIYLTSYRPLTAGVRFKKSVVTFKFFKFFKKFFYFKKVMKAGRNNSGGITVLHRGGCATKRAGVLLNYNRRWSKQLSLLVQISQNSILNIFVGLVKYTNGSYAYIRLQHGCFIGQIFQTAYLPLRFFTLFGPGNTAPLKFLDLRSVFSNIIVLKKNKSKYCRSAGTYCRVWQKHEDFSIVTVVLPTKKKKHFADTVFVTLGRNSNIFHFYNVVGKAGKNRFKNLRPHVRGVAMNPVDHPHGGRTKSNSPEVSLWGWVTKKNH